MKAVREPLDERPFELRTRDYHWRFWARAGIIKCYNLVRSADGQALEVGICRIALTRAHMKERPDLLKVLLEVLQTWT